MARWPRATYLGPPDGNWGGSMAEFRGMVQHIAEGSYWGTIGWQQNPVSDVSSHFVVDLDGACAQMLDTALVAWTQGAGNGHWVSVEVAGFATGLYTPAQQETLSQLYAWLATTHGVPLQITDTTKGRGWGWHGMGGVAWGNHPGCPGAGNVALRPAMLARTNQILNGINPSPGPVPGPEPTPGDTDMPRIFRVADGSTAGLVGVTNGPTWSHLGSGEAVATFLRFWGLPESAVQPIHETDLPGMGVQVVSNVDQGNGGGSGGGSGDGASPVEVRTIVRSELDNTRFLGQLERDPSA